MVQLEVKLFAVQIRSVMRVVITGMGAVSPLGDDVEALWSGMLAGRSGVRDFSSDGERFASLPIPIAAPAVVDVDEKLGRVAAQRLDRSQRLALIAAAEAWADAGTPEVDGDRFAVVVGTGIGGLETLLGQDDVLEASGARRVSPRAVPMLMPNGAAAQVSIAYGAGAGVYTTAAACASGAEAIADAARLLATGEADIVFAGGVEASIAPLTLAAFAQAQAAAKPDGGPVDALSRPFDAARRGFVLGEGAGMLVLETEEHAQRRGARVHAVLAGWSVTSDAFHITAPQPEGRGQVRAIRNALKMAGLAPEDIDHVNAHATGTTVGDTTEAAAIAESLGTTASVTAPKGAIGHLLGAAGAVEAILAIRTMTAGLVPPTRNLDELDPAVPLDVVRGAPREQEVRAALSDSFGFGGQNTSLIFTRP
ncbi:beta-ketoacyl-[acyl-carrier-protein] synthase family protein [Amnibacterium soli]|uniref:beta-ketoacyl-[acyl-carrier-protein] synthase family protein n=1 Tax=Amnibacterium soli TaxID=1282736 RepID=UPI0031EA0129